jgi:peroxiredoxin Q/BCP
MLLSGIKAPEFILPNENGELISLKDFLGKKVVLYFYPKDSTPGCTQQALGYKNNYNEYLDKDIVVIGISKDSVKSHKNFKTKNELPFILLSDENLDAISKYDVWHEKKMCGKAYMGVVRTTYIINEEGKIIYANDKVKAVNDALDILRLL